MPSLADFWCTSMSVCVFMAILGQCAVNSPRDVTARSSASFVLVPELELRGARSSSGAGAGAAAAPKQRSPYAAAPGGGIRRAQHLKKQRVAFQKRK